MPPVAKADGEHLLSFLTCELRHRLARSLNAHGCRRGVNDGELAFSEGRSAPARPHPEDADLIADIEPSEGWVAIVAWSQPAKENRAPRTVYRDQLAPVPQRPPLGDAAPRIARPSEFRGRQRRIGVSGAVGTVGTEPAR